MPVAFLAPAFLAGLAALVVPVLIHLIQRERKEVVAFPSLMFLRRIPYQSVERRRIHNWLLLALRAAAIACLVAAFSRPFLKEGVAAAAARSGAREVVILLDVSASMGYGDHWAHAVDAAHKVVATLGAEDRCTLVLFARNAEENVRATSDRTARDSHRPFGSPRACCPARACPARKPFSSATSRRPVGSVTRTSAC